MKNTVCCFNTCTFAGTMWALAFSFHDGIIAHIKLYAYTHKKSPRMLLLITSESSAVWQRRYAGPAFASSAAAYEYCPYLFSLRNAHL
jgi:hypothetical protein